jgi:crotonobetainyl-CoA:carnitine CoA-transferase CaiB-like acyl-CoA transferase
MIVGDLGADVIKVESPAGDPVRLLAPPQLGGDATYYLALNRHRRNVVADLRDPTDFARVAQLVQLADAVVENYLPSQIASLGVDRLRGENPGCVWVSVASASSGGPLADEPSFDLLAQARSGLMAVTGDASGPPNKVGAPLADVVTGLYATIGLLSGLYAKGHGNGGRHFEAPLLESTMSALVNQAQGYLSTNEPPRRMGNDHPSIAPYGPVTTSDGFLLLAVGTDAQYERLTKVVGDEALSSRLAWATNAQRVANLPMLRDFLNDIFSRATTSEWLKVLRDSGVPHAPILEVDEAFAQAQVSQGDFLTTMEVPSGSTRAMRSPLRIDGQRPEIRRGPRRLGEDSGEVFATEKD